MKIRKATKNDFKNITRLANKLKVKGDDEGWFLSEALNNMIPVEIKVNSTLVAVKDNKIVGFLNYFSEEGVIEIAWLGVDPKLHGKGIGKKLVQKIESTAKKLNVKYIIVDTVPKKQANKPYKKTIEFYERMGFKNYKIEKKAYKNCDKAIMRKIVLY